MFKIRLYKGYQKRDNALTVPDDLQVTHTDVDVNLKDYETNIEAPIVILAQAGTIKDVTYAYIPTWSRFYFVTGITQLTTGHTQLTLAEDCLASFYNKVINANKYILRAASAAPENAIYPDEQTIGTGLYDVTEAPIVIKECEDYEQATHRYFIVGIESRVEDSYRGHVRGGTNYYVFNEQDLQKLVNYLIGNDSGEYSSGTFVRWLDVVFSNITDDAEKAQFNPLQYIKSVVEYPFEIVPPLPSFKEDYIPIGRWNLPKDLEAPYLYVTPGVSPNITQQQNMYSLTIASIDIPKHTDRSIDGIFADIQYMKYSIFFPPFFDKLDLDPAILYPFRKLSFDLKVDLPTGDAILVVKATDGISVDLIIGIFEQNIGTPIAITELTGNSLNQIGAAVGAIGTAIASVATKGAHAVKKGTKAVVSGISGAAGVAEAAAGFSVSGYSMSQSSNYTAMTYWRRAGKQTAYLQACKEEFTHPSWEEVGRLIMDDGSLSGYTGFVKCSDGYIDLGNATAAEKEKVKQYLEDGIFIGTYTPPAPVSIQHFNVNLNMEPGVYIQDVEGGIAQTITGTDLQIIDKLVDFINEHRMLIADHWNITVKTGLVSDNFHPMLYTLLNTAYGSNPKFTVTEDRQPNDTDTYATIYCSSISREAFAVASENGFYEYEDHQATNIVNRCKCLPDVSVFDVSYPQNAPTAITDIMDDILLKLTQAGINYQLV